jgi:hypothetical protein
MGPQSVEKVSKFFSAFVNNNYSGGDVNRSGAASKSAAMEKRSLRFCSENRCTYGIGLPLARINPMNPMMISKIAVGSEMPVALSAPLLEARLEL